MSYPLTIDIQMLHDQDIHICHNRKYDSSLEEHQPGNTSKRKEIKSNNMT